MATIKTAEKYNSYIAANENNFGRNNIIDSKELKKLSQLKPWKTCMQIAIDWSVIFAMAYVTELYWNPLLYILSVFIIGGRIHAFVVLMHEAAHYRIFKGSKKLNDIVGDIFMAWPVLATVDSYRRNHLAHHRYLNTDNDPDWAVKKTLQEFQFPQEKKKLTSHIYGYFIGTNIVKDVILSAKRLFKLSQHSKRYKYSRITYYVFVVSTVLYFGIGKELLLYWIVPFFTTFLCFMYVRSIAEHFGSMQYGVDLKESRNVYPKWWEKLLFPHNVNYHLDHHLYPSVPYYNLKKLHKLLLKEKLYKDNAHITHGYFTGVINECSK